MSMSITIIVAHMTYTHYLVYFLNYINRLERFLDNNPPSDAGGLFSSE
jgi:hypothetical protein